VGSASAAGQLTVVPRRVTPPPVVATPDRTPPTTTIRHHAADDPARHRQRCRLGARRPCAGDAQRRPALPVPARERHFSRPQSCRTNAHITATGTTSWRLELPVLAPGRYRVWSRGIDAAGNVERKNAARNLRRFRIPTRRAARAPA
jgi:hypothetical protein